MEYEAAVLADIPCLIFLMDPDAPHKPKFVAKGEEGQKIDQLRQHLGEKYTVSFFKNVEQLRDKVSAAVSNPRLSLNPPHHSPKEINDMANFSKISDKTNPKRKRNPHPLVLWLVGACLVLVAILIGVLINNKSTNSDSSWVIPAKHNISVATPAEKTSTLKTSQQNPEQEQPTKNKSIQLPKKK